MGKGRHPRFLGNSEEQTGVGVCRSNTESSSLTGQAGEVGNPDPCRNLLPVVMALKKPGAVGHK